MAEGVRIFAIEGKEYPDPALPAEIRKQTREKKVLIVCDDVGRVTAEQAESVEG